MEFIPVESDALAGVAYHITDWSKGLGACYIQFKSGDIWKYFYVPATTFSLLLNASSKGRFYADTIKGRFEGVKLSQEQWAVESRIYTETDWREPPATKPTTTEFRGEQSPSPAATLRVITGSGVTLTFSVYTVKRGDFEDATLTLAVDGSSVGNFSTRDALKVEEFLKFCLALM